MSKVLVDGIPVERLSEICRAEQEGRLVVLPCKVGDTVYVDARTWGNAWNYITVMYGRFLVGEIVSIIKTKKQVLMKIQVKHNVEWMRPRKRYTISAIGVTVFLTIEAAEQALEKEKTAPGTAIPESGKR